MSRGSIYSIVLRYAEIVSKIAPPILGIFILAITHDALFADQANCYPDDANMWTGSVDGGDYTKADGDPIAYRGTGGPTNETRCWIKFNTSGIPDGSGIIGVVLYAYCTDTPGGNGVDVWSAENDPVPTVGSVLFDDCGDGSRYFNNWTCQVNQWNSVALGGGAVDTLENHLSDDWFAIGFRANDTHDSVVFTGHGGSNRPYINVTFNPIGVAEGGDLHVTKFFIEIPNPLRNNSVIRYGLPKVCNIRITIYNILGQEIRTLVKGKKSAGLHSVTWDRRNNVGEVISRGVYFLRFEAEEYKTAKKFLVTE